VGRDISCGGQSYDGGEFYALVGPNGAGKTTTLRMVVGLLKPDAGSIRIGGIDALSDPVAAKQTTAWLSDEPMIYDKLTPYEYLEFVAGLWRIDPAVAQARARELIGWLGLEPHAHERCEGSPAECARRWRSLARWCTTQSSSFSTNR
jgi:ABC-2 type transport system ATP-binding protein